MFDFSNFSAPKRQAGVGLFGEGGSVGGFFGLSRMFLFPMSAVTSNSGGLMLRLLPLIRATPSLLQESPGVLLTSGPAPPS